MRSRPRPCAWPARAAARRPPRGNWVAAPSCSTAGRKRRSWPQWAVKQELAILKKPWSVPASCTGSASRPGRARRAQPAARPVGPHRPQPGVGRRHHVPAPPGRWLALPGRVAQPLLAQNRRLGRTRHNALSPGQRGAPPGLGRAAPPSWVRGPLRPGKPVHGHAF
jgi:hypothetical protein